jgi:hypothetical protein
MAAEHGLPRFCVSCRQTVMPRLDSLSWICPSCGARRPLSPLAASQGRLAAQGRLATLGHSAGEPCSCHANRLETPERHASWAAEHESPRQAAATVAMSEQSTRLERTLAQAVESLYVRLDELAGEVELLRLRLQVQDRPAGK